MTHMNVNLKPSQSDDSGSDSTACFLLTWIRFGYRSMSLRTVSDIVLKVTLFSYRGVHIFKQHLKMACAMIEVG